MTDRRPHWFYKITVGGQGYIDRMASWYTYYDQAKAELAEAEVAAFTANFLPGEFRPFGIAWPVYPGARRDPGKPLLPYGVSISWPYLHAMDAGFCHPEEQIDYYLRVDNLNQARAMAYNLFETNPSQACLDQALSIQKEVARAHGFIVTEK